MICNNCGTENSDDAQFCAGCGLNFYTGNVYAANQNGQNYAQDFGQNYSAQNIYVPQGMGSFVNADEQVVATLKNGRAQNVLSGEGFRNEDAVITNRRLYYNHTDGLINIKRVERKVDIKDVTGTRIEDNRPRGLLIAAAAMCIIAILSLAVSGEAETFITCLLPAVIFGIGYILGVKKYLRIDYAGGYVSFSVRNYRMENVQEFQRCIHAVKDTMQ